MNTAMEAEVAREQNFDAKSLWDKVLSEVELSVSKANFSTWFKDTEIAKQEDGVIYVAVQNAFVKDWLFNKYHKFILKALRSISEHVRGLDYVIVREDDRKKAVGQQKPPLPPTAELPLGELYTDKETNLNPRYTFESFVVGPFNELAHTAAQTVIGKPGIAFNPLFVYGNTGHGKTHLIQAVGNQIKNASAGAKKVYYLTSERFSQEFINAVQVNRVNLFKEKYARYDVLIMDDIQFFSNKEKSQEELFHLFNRLYENNKQIVFSSDKHPNYIPSLEDRLKSRFAAGMIVDIPPPDRESRTAIIKAKMHSSNFQLVEEAVDYLSATIEGNIRELEGILNSLMCQTGLRGRPLSFVEIKNLIKTNIKPKKIASVKEVVKAVVDFYNIEEESVYEKTRRKEVVKPRQLAMYILREDCGISYPLIGERLGGRDHTTVIHSCEKIREELKNDSVLEGELNQIRAML
jgi:chromosomal replication initiator protein